MAVGGASIAWVADVSRAERLDTTILYTGDDVQRGCWGLCAFETPRLFFTTNPRPLYTLVTGLVEFPLAHLGVPPRLSVRIVQWGFSTAALATVVALGEEVGLSLGATLLALLWIATNPLYFLVSLAGLQEILTAFLHLEFFLLYYRKRWLPSAAVLSLILLVRLESAPFLALLTGVFLWKRRWREALVVPVGIGAYYLSSYAVLGMFGDDFYKILAPAFSPAPWSFAEAVGSFVTSWSGSYGTGTLLLTAAAALLSIRSPERRLLAALPLSMLSFLAYATMRSWPYWWNCGRYVLAGFPAAVLLVAWTLDRMKGRAALLGGAALLAVATNVGIARRGLPPQCAAHLLHGRHPDWGRDLAGFRDAMDWIDWYVKTRKPEVLFLSWDLYDITMNCHCSWFRETRVLSGPDGRAYPPWMTSPSFLDFTSMRAHLSEVPSGEGIYVTDVDETWYRDHLAWNEVVARFPNGIVVYRIPRAKGP